MLKSVSNAGARRGIAQSGSASGLGPEGRRFESCCPDQLKTPGTNRDAPRGNSMGQHASGSEPAQIVGGCSFAWPPEGSPFAGQYAFLELPLEQSRHIEQKFFDCADRVASRGFTRKSRSTTVSQASQAMISQWCLETSAAGTSGRRKENPGIASHARLTASSVRQSRSIEATILTSNQASYVALQPAVCDGREGSEREGTQQVQSRRIGGAG